MGSFTIASGQEGIVNAQCSAKYGSSNVYGFVGIWLNGVKQAGEGQHDEGYGDFTVGASFEVVAGDVVSCSATQSDSSATAQTPNFYRFTVQR